MRDFTIIVKPNQWPLVQRLRNGIPGPFLAKLSPLWKVIHVLRGTYRASVFKLHKHYGPLVQVGPNEYSLADKGLVYIPKLTLEFFAVDTTALHQLHNSIQMASVFQYEHLIERCNWQLCCLFIDAADQGKAVELSPLLTRYAYDAMLATTTGQLGGFLENRPNATRLAAQLNSWKFHAVLFGAYLKFNPIISQILRACGLRGTAEHKVFADTKLSTSKSTGPVPTVGDDTDRSSQQKHNKSAPKPLAQDTEARIALTLAGTDPAIKLIQTALSYIYSDSDLLQKLRDEMKQAELSPTPLFKELISQRSRMPLLHAVLLECIRLSPPLVTGPTYVTREEDVQIGGRSFPKDTTISLEPTVAHVNPTWFGDDADKFDPTKWLDFEKGSQARRHLLAFNLAFDRINSLEEYQILLTCKLLALLLPYVTMEFNAKTSTFNAPGPMQYDPIVVKYCDALLNMKPVITHGENSSAMGAKIDRKTADTLSRQEIFHCNLDEDTLKAFCVGGRFDSSKTDFTGERVLVTNPISMSVARAKTRQAFKEIYGNRLWWTHDPKTDVIRISLPKSKDTRNKRDREGAYRNTQNRAPKELSSSPVRPKNTPHGSEPNDALIQSTSRFIAFSVRESASEKARIESREAAYAEKKAMVAQAHIDAAKDGTAEYKPLKSTFKQTFTKQDNDNTTAEAEAQADQPKAKPIPPHLRKKLASD